MGRFAVVVLLVVFLAPSAVAQVPRPTCFGSVATIVGSNKDDKMQGTSGPDVIASLDGDDSINAGGGDDKICSGNGGDVVLGEGGNDSINGGEGSDGIEPGPGNDTVIGGPASDSVFFLSAPGPVDANLATGVATGNGRDTLQEVESLEGSPFPDTLTGDAGINVLGGAAGNDTLAGGESSDGLLGEAGDDKLNGRPNDGDAAIFFSATGPVQADLNAGVATGEGRDTLVNIESLIGSSFGDKLVGNSKLNFLIGLGGNDELVGGDGFDVAVFLSPVTANLATQEARGDGVDKLTGFEGLAGISAGTDRLTGDARQNFIDGGAGDDVIDGGAGTDILFGKDGSDRITGGAGNDRFFGGLGDDVIDGGAGTSDTASYLESATAVHANLAAKSATGEGSDVLTGVEGLSGSQFNDELTGDPKPNELFGNDGDDLLVGGAGSDFLGGGAGNDTIQPGAGKDYCIDDQPTPGCEILGAPTIPGAPEQPPIPTGSRAVQGSPSFPSSTSPSARSAGSAIDVLAWLGRAARDLDTVGPAMAGGQVSALITPAIGPLPVRPTAAGAVRQTAGFEYSAEPVCISAGGRRLTEIAPPKIVGPVGDDGQREEAWWQGTLYRQDRKTGKFRRQAKTAWARAQLAGDFVLSGVVAWKTANGQNAFASPVAIRVPKGKYVWKGQIYWIRSGGRIFAAIEPHIIRAKTIQHRKTCDFKK